MRSYGYLKKINMKHTVIIFSILGSIILVLLMVQISVSNILSTGGIALSEIQQETQDLQRQNAILKEKVLSISSLTYVAEKAEKEGFAPDKMAAVVISNAQPPIALNQ